MLLPTRRAAGTFCIVIEARRYHSVLMSDRNRDLRSVCDGSADRGYGDGVSPSGSAGAAAATAVALQTTAARKRASNQKQEHDDAMATPGFASRGWSLKQN